MGYQTLCWTISPYAIARTAIATLPAKPPFTPAELGYVSRGSRARCRPCVIQFTRATAGRLVATGTGSSNTGTDSCFSCGSTSRNQPTYPVRANIAPRILTDTVVSIPANTRVMPNARTIGQAVGDGMVTAFGASSWLFVGSSTVTFE